MIVDYSTLSVKGLTSLELSSILYSLGLYEKDLIRGLKVDVKLLDSGHFNKDECLEIVERIIFNLERKRIVKKMLTKF